MFKPSDHLPQHLPQSSGFLSSCLSLAAILVVLWGLYLFGFATSRRHAERLVITKPPSQPGSSSGDTSGISDRTALLSAVTQISEGSRQQHTLEWNALGRTYLFAVTSVLFGINTFSIVASALDEPILREPKTWAIKIISIPLALCILAHLLIRKPQSCTPVQLNHTLLLISLLILFLLLPIFTGLPPNTDYGRVSLARKILEDVVGPAFLLGGLIAVHRTVVEVYLDRETGAESTRSSSICSSRRRVQ